MTIDRNAKGAPNRATWTPVTLAAGYHVRIRYSDGRTTDVEQTKGDRTIPLRAVEPDERVTVVVRAVDADDDEGRPGTATAGSRQRAPVLRIPPARVGVGVLEF